ncbi:MAG: gene transfer agent family protein [Pseudomonadota bacterium]
MSANPYRGEVTLTLNGELHHLRLSLGSLAGLEAELGAEGLLPLIQRFEDGQFSSADLIALLFAGLKGGGWTGTVADLEQAEIEGGILAAARSAGEMLALAFSLPKAV